VHVLLVLIPLTFMAGYFALLARILLHLHGEVPFRERLKSVSAMGPGRFFSRTWRSLIAIVAGLAILPVALISYDSYLAYRAAPACGISRPADCRVLRQLQVTHVEIQSSRSGDNTVVDFSGGYSATFSADDVPQALVSAGSSVTAEVWRGYVTAVVIDGQKHESYGSQSEAWIGIAAGGLLVLVGITWVLVDLAFATAEPISWLRDHGFASPVKRRRGLYVLLAAFGLLVGSLGLAAIAASVGAATTADTLAAIYLIGGVVAVPILVAVFVSWFVRAYMNLGALGIHARHSAWFVTAGLLVPPLSLYMPYRLMEEVTTRTKAPLTPAMLQTWSVGGVAWLVLTALGVTLSSSDPHSFQSWWSGVMLALSVVAGLLAAALTWRVIRAIDGAELALAHKKHG
jgi:Domain of unknown function (DUF4328)